MRKTKRPGDWPWQQPEGSLPVDVERITRDPALQVRAGTDPALVRRYANEMKAGARFPPVELAETEDGTLLLVEGWHRLEAAHIVNGQKTVEATKRAMSRQEATGWASMANLTHGKQLAEKDKRRALALYITARKHRTAKGLKTYRDIARDLLIKLPTLYRWMAKDHPKIAQDMARDPTGGSSGAPPPIDPEPEILRRLEQAARDAQGMFDRLLSPEARGEAIFYVNKLLEQMKEQEHISWPPPF